MSKSSALPRPPSGYTLESHFRKLRSRWCFTPLEHYVFSELIAICNEEGWPAEFSATNALLVAGIGCSEPGLIKARKRLAEAGLLTYTEGKHRRPTAYRFCLPKGLTEFSDGRAEHLTEGLTEFSIQAAETDKHLTEHLTEGLTEFSPYKEQTKTKTILLTEGERVSSQADSELNTSTPPPPALEQPTSRPKKGVKPSEGGPDFASFWQAYGNKKGRHKSELKWQALTPAERVAALAAVPAYVARTPNLQFRKHPLSWLNGKHWEDEELAPTSALPTLAATEPLAPTLNHEVMAEREAQRKAAFRAHLARHAAQPATD